MHDLIRLQRRSVEGAAPLHRPHEGRRRLGDARQCARSRSGTPVHVSVVDQPSTQAIGSRAVCCGIAASIARSSTTGAGPPVSVRRQRSPVRSGVIRAAAAVRLTWKSLGPSPRVRPRGSSSAAWRVNPPRVWPAVITAMNNAPPPTSARAPRRLIVGGCRLGGDQAVCLRTAPAGYRRGWCAALPATTSTADPSTSWGS